MKPGQCGNLTRRDLLKAGLTVGAAAAVGPWPVLGASVRPQRSKPNILLLMTDQQRWDCVGAAGNPVIKTPHLDRLAREGVLFKHAYSAVPSCTPARAALLTGMAPWNNGLLGYGRVGEEYPMTMPQALRDAGYYTLGIGKMHWHPQRNLHGFHRTILDESARIETINFRSDYRSWLFSQAPGVDPDATGLTFNDYRARPYVLPEEYHPTHWTGTTACNFLQGYNRPEPFFLKVSFERPHNPYDAPQRFLDLYADEPIPPAVVGNWAARYAPRSAAGPDIWHGAMGSAQVRASRQGYYGNISFIDEQIGNIVRTLEQRGLLDNTLILFTSDHGDMLGDNHLWRKTYAYEGSAHVPLIIRWPQGRPAVRRGITLEQIVEMRDILPTFLDAAGAPAANQLDGTSLLSLIDHPTAQWRSHLALEHDLIYGPHNYWTAVTDGHDKYIFHCATGEEQLFDLDADRGETMNLAGIRRHAERLAAWRQRMVEYLAPRGEPFIRAGKLAIRTESHLYSPNYPGCRCHGKARPFQGSKKPEPA